MITESAALERILTSVESASSRLRKTITLPLPTALHHYAASALHSPASLPAFDNSAMDGYALRAGDATTPLRVTGDQPAGPDRNLNVTPATAIRIFTGAPIPAGADCVVMQEDVTRDGDTITLREPNAPPEPGEFIRRAGSDLCIGQSVLTPGDRLTPARIALLTSLGIQTIEVHPLPRIGIIATGDELIQNPKPSEARQPANFKPDESGQSKIQNGEIFDSNTPLLTALLATSGFPVALTTHARDTPAALHAALDTTADCDAIILTGGVSVGEHDHVRATLRARGATADFWRVAVKPGKPFLFAHNSTTTYFGLPGNPVSTLVTALLFVLPGLRRLAGAHPTAARNLVTLFRVEVPLENPGDRPHYFRGTADEHGTFRPAPLQQSHAAASLAQSSVLLRIPARTTLPRGSYAPGLILPGF